MTTVDSMPESIQTSRLELRVPNIGDAQAMFEEYSRDAKATRYLSWRVHREPDEATTYIAARMIEWQEGSRWTYAVTLLESPRMIGHIRLTPSEHGISFGFVIASRFAGRGIISETMRVLIPLCESRAERLWAYCDTENLASSRVLKKVGFQLESIAPKWRVFPNISGEPRDCFIFARRRGAYHHNKTFYS